MVRPGGGETAEHGARAQTLPREPGDGRTSDRRRVGRLATASDDDKIRTHNGYQHRAADYFLYSISPTDEGILRRRQGRRR